MKNMSQNQKQNAQYNNKETRSTNTKQTPNTTDKNVQIIYRCTHKKQQMLNGNKSYFDLF